MHLHFRVEDDLSALHRAGERAAAHLPDSTQRWHARVDFAKANSVREKTVQLSGTVMVTWPPNQRFDIPVTPDFSPFIVPNFSGDIAIVTMPVLTIDGRSETFPPVTVQRRTGVTMGGVNGC
ncbi:hypothetical protein [Ferrovibrio sp.]|uniref:hypothetical protein n=1 Tax=Ferrovibrio sp. TaxID=1917215 RepID=UPI0035AE8D2E